jgi:copper oxidase (laccase) domain-containing protein
VLQADWPAPPGVHALTTPAWRGHSPAPFAQFNLGNRHAADGDTPANVEHNRQLLQQGLALPSAPHWLRQVHSSTVLRFTAPPVPPASRWPMPR